MAPDDEEVVEQKRDLLSYEVDVSDVIIADKEMQDWQALYRGLLRHCLDTGPSGS